MDLEDMVAAWPAPHVSASVVSPTGPQATAGDPDLVFALASVTKLFTAWAVLIASEEGVIELGTVVTDAGATVADLLAHAGGLGPDGAQLTQPRTRRIYSNAGYDRVAAVVSDAAGMSFDSYVTEAVFEPLQMASSKLDSPAHGAVSTLTDLTTFAAELLAPRLLADETAQRATRTHLAQLGGVLPGFGSQDPNPWGLGPEIRGDKSPHWTGATNSADTFGHFGQSGTFVWVDPAIAVACVVLTDEPFGPWAIKGWPEISDHVVSESA